MKLANVIFSTKFEIKEEADKVKASKMGTSLFNKAKQIVEKTFMESAEGKMGAITTLGEKEYLFRIFLYMEFYDKHIGKLVKEQREKELKNLYNKLSLAGFPETNSISFDPFIRAERFEK